MKPWSFVLPFVDYMLLWTHTQGNRCNGTDSISWHVPA